MDESFFIPYEATTELPAGNVLVLAPHPDDEVFGCAGAIMQHVAQQHSVTVIVVTDGRAARPHTDTAMRETYVAMREQESRAAAQVLGYGEPQFWREIDRELVADANFVTRLRTHIQAAHIQHVYAPAISEIHPDHYTLAQAAIQAVADCGADVQLCCYEVGVPLHPNRLLDITPYLERKRQAMHCFPSQLAIQDYSEHLFSLNRFRSYSLPPSVVVAEAYYVIDGATLQAHPLRRYGITRQTYEMERMAAS